jgi:hypothetical protein
MTVASYGKRRKRKCRAASWATAGTRFTTLGGDAHGPGVSSLEPDPVAFWRNCDTLPSLGQTLRNPRLGRRPVLAPMQSERRLAGAVSLSLTTLARAVAPSSLLQRCRSRAG